MNRFLAFILMLLLSSCYGTRHYVGLTPEINYELHFLTESERPIAGVHVDCRLVEAGKSFNETITTSFFDKSTTSDENGFLVVNQRSHKTGGSYNYIGSYEWGHKHSKSLETICNFYLQEKLLYSSNMNKYIGNSKNFIHIK